MIQPEESTAKEAAEHRIEPLPPGFQRTMLVVTTLFITIIAALDMTIVSVALPYMAGNLGASLDEITWVITMFMVAQAITIAVTGHLSRILGRKRLAIIVVIWFVGFSALCGLAQSLGQIVFFRFMQGFASGPLIPLSQSILIDAYPKEDRTRVLSLWTMGVMGGPALGPAIGGYLAQVLDWRWNFWVNIPVGAVALILILRFLRTVPPQRAKTDWLGLSFLIILVVSLQVGLDRGDDLDWFSSRTFVLLAIFTVTAAIAFVGRGILRGKDNIVNLKLLADRNFAACSLLLAIMGIGFLGLLVLAPELFVHYLGWELTTAGKVIGVYGVAAFFGSFISGRIAPIVGTRRMILVSCVFMTIGWFLFSRTNINAGPWELMLPGMIIEFGLMLIYPVLAAQAFATLPPEQRDEGAGLFNFIKTVGLALGVTLVNVLIYRGNQANWNRYVGEINPTNPGLQSFLQDLGLEQVTPEAGAMLSGELARQTGVLTWVQTAQVLAVVAMLSATLALLLKSPAKENGEDTGEIVEAAAL